MTIQLTVNGAARAIEADAGTPLLYVLRDELGLNGAKYGCGIGMCGACTVLRDGRAVRSCLVPLGSVAGRSVTTVEGLGTGGERSALQQAFLDEQAGQCGYCIPGMIMTAAGLLREQPDADEPAIRRSLAGNLCRCGSHNRIVRAVLRDARTAA